MTAYRVAAKYVTLKLLDSVSGKAQVHGFYEGAMVPSSVEDESLQKHLDSGMVVEVDEAEVPAGEPEAPAEPKAPAKSASKADWVAYVTEHKGVSQEDAEAATRDELAAAYGD